MKTILFIFLFIIGGMFINASHVLSWFLGAGKPSHPNWKTYGIIGLIIWILVLILANILP